jgi:hypothetical protein
MDNNGRDKQMPNDTQTRKRRTHWQVIAGRKYPRLTFLGGDGGATECWVVLTKCPHDQTRHWRYALTASKVEAEAWLAEWKQSRCGYQCQGDQLHTLWRIHEW